MRCLRNVVKCKTTRKGLPVRAMAVSVALLLLSARAAADSWGRYAGRPDAWFASEEGIQVAENILSYQLPDGGWPKNVDMAAGPRDAERSGRLLGTFDNGATHGEMRFMARAYRATKRERFKESFLKGLDYVFRSQYPSGGWPQFYPLRGGYSDHITFNDGAMIGVMEILRDVIRSPEFAFVDESRRERARRAHDAGVGCILRCQIKVDGRLEAWCAQHDAGTLEPRPARSYEKASLSGGESAGIVLFLMGIETPGLEVQRAVEGACAWYERSRIKGIRIVRKDDDRVVVPDPGAPPLWARFYDIRTNRPIFCGRDGVIKERLADIERERRTGYAWYGAWGQRVLDRWPEWRRKVMGKRETLPDASEPPVIPIGPDAFTRWERWPYLRIGVRAYMKSTFDRTGGNYFADSGHYILQIDDEHNVVLDEVGPGILWFVRHNHWHGSPWRYTVDGRETVVQESSTADPTQPVPGSVFLPEALFPQGLTWTWSETKGADLSWVPIPFERSLELAYSRTRYGTGYFIFWRVMPGIPHLSRPLRSWTDADVPPRSVLELLEQAGTDIAPEGEGVTRLEGRFSLEPFETRTVLESSRAPAVIRRLAFTVPDRGAEAFSRARLRIFWDGRSAPSVDAPLGLFFGTGSLMRTPGQEHIVRSFPMTVRRNDRETLFATYFPMPFLRGARIEVAEGEGAAVEGVGWEVRHVHYPDPPNWVGLFHATYRNFPHPEPGRDLVLLDTRQVEGGGPWCGHFVGTTYLFTRTGTLNTLEGDPRFYFDDSLSPQCQGTGSEEWGGGGDYWGGRTMTLPFAGHPVGKPPGKMETALDRIHSAYRFLLADLMPFGRNARITLEHGANSTSREHYETVTYWYGVDRPGLVLTDEVDVGDPADEKLHGYVSPDASDVLHLVSRHELGVDHLPIPGGRGRTELFPPVGDDGRMTRTRSEFNIDIKTAQKNLGVLLRRRLDLAYPNQRARVMVAGADGPSRWEDAGTWYTAGGNTVVFGDPLALPEAERKLHPEIAPPAHIVKTSNRRWREDEFMIPRKLTEGRDAIRVRLEFVPVGLPLFPGHPPAEEAWTEYRYWAYCFVMPRTAGE